MTEFGTEEIPETEHFGFTRIGSNESLDKNGYAFLDADVTLRDDLLFALMSHRHTGEPALEGPTDEAGLVAQSTGGQLAASTSFFYRVSYLDTWGLETAASPEATITTPDPYDNPTPPAATVESASGTLPAGNYSYVISHSDGFGGQTGASDANNVQIPTGVSNRVRFDLPQRPSGVVSTNIYRARPGQTSYYLIGTSTSDQFYDDGLVEDQSITVPLDNTTNAANAIAVTVPGAFIPDGAFGWRLYRTDVAGDYDGSSLVAEITDGATDGDGTLRTSFLDVGDPLAQGFPRDRSNTIAMPPVIDLGEIQGSLPRGALPRGSQCISAASGQVQDRVVTMTDVPQVLRPTRLTAYFGEAPDPSVTVTITVEDEQGTTVELVCSDALHKPADPSGYWRASWPSTVGGTYQAENGQRSSSSVPIVTDLAAVSGQAVALGSSGEWVQVVLGVLEAGSYTSSASLRVMDYLPGGAGSGDLVIEALRTDTSVVLAATSYSPSDGNLEYQDLAGPTFVAPGGAPVALRIRKANSNAQDYNVDSGTATAVTPSLGPGRIAISTEVDGAAAGEELNVSLWF